MDNKVRFIKRLILSLFLLSIITTYAITEWIPPVVENNLGENTNVACTLQKDRSGNIWLLYFGEVYRFDRGKFLKVEIDKKNDDKTSNSYIGAIWSGDTLYGRMNLNREHYELFKYDSKANTMVKINDFSSSFTFYKNQGDGYLIVNGEGTIMDENKKILGELNISPERSYFINMSSIKFSEYVKGHVWIWTNDSTIFTQNFKRKIILISEGKYNAIFIPHYGLSSVYSVSEIEPNIVIISQTYNGYKSVKIKLSLENGVYKDEQDSGFVEGDGECILEFLKASANKNLVFIKKSGFGGYSIYNYIKSQFVKVVDLDISGMIYVEKATLNCDSSGNIWVSYCNENVFLVTKENKIQKIGWEAGLDLNKVEDIYIDKTGYVLFSKKASSYTDISKNVSILKISNFDSITFDKRTKLFEEFNVFNKIIKNSKGQLFWVDMENRKNHLMEFDGNEVKEIKVLGFETDYKLKTGDKIFNGFCIDSLDRIWVLFSEYQGENKYFKFLNDNEDKYIEFMKFISLTVNDGLSGSVELSNSSIVLFYHDNKNITYLDKGVTSYGSRTLRLLKRIKVFNGNEWIPCNLNMDEKEYLIEGVFKSKDGNCIINSYNTSTNSESNSYIFKDGKWDRLGNIVSNAFLINETYQDLVKADLNIEAGIEYIGINDKDGVLIQKNRNIYLKKNNDYYIFKNIPVEYYSNSDITDVFYTQNGDLWIKSNMRILHIKSENISKLIDLVPKASICEIPGLITKDNKKEKLGSQYNKIPMTYMGTKVATRITGDKTNGLPGENTDDLDNTITSSIVAGIPVSSGEKLLKDKTDLQIGNITSKKEQTGELEKVMADSFNKLSAGNKEEIEAASKAFILIGQASIEYLKTKRSETKDENITWRIDAIISRIEK